MTAPGSRATPDGFLVDPDALAAHAAAVDLLAGRIRGTAGAARPVDPGAYGVVGQLFAGTAATAAADGIAAIDIMAGAAATTAAALRAVQAGYLDAERAAVAGLIGVRR